MNDERQDAVGFLVRAGADGELTEAQERLLEDAMRDDTDIARAVRFESDLREATGRIMGNMRAPAHVRDRIEDARPRRLHIWRSAPAMAASIVLVLGALAWLVVPMRPVSDAQYRINLVRFLDNEHTRCWVDADGILRKFTVRAPEELPDASERILDAPLDASSLLDDPQLQFIGAGRCAVPGPGKSIHLGFDEFTSGVAVSLFVQQAHARLPLEEGVTYRLDVPDDGHPSFTYAWKEGDLLYFLVSGDRAACSHGMDAADAPETRERL